MRKLVILAREAGYNIEPDQVRVESLVPAHCEGGSIDHFFENGDELNEQMVQRLEAAREMGLVLRYVASPPGRFSRISTGWHSCCNFRNLIMPGTHVFGFMVSNEIY